MLVLSLLILQLDMLNTCRSGIFKNLIGFATSEALLWLSVIPQTTQLFWRKLAPHHPLSTSFAKCFCLSVGGELPPLCIPPLPPSRRQLCAPLGWEHCGQSSLCTVLVLILLVNEFHLSCIESLFFLFLFAKLSSPLYLMANKQKLPWGVGYLSIWLVCLFCFSWKVIFPKVESHLFVSPHQLGATQQ